MGRLSELDEIERRGLVPEKEPRVYGRRYCSTARPASGAAWEAALKDWWKNDFPAPADPDTALADRLFRGGFEAGVAHARAELQAAAREVLPAEDPQGGKLWRCEGCGQEFEVEPGPGHVRSDAGDDYCGPVVEVED